MKRKILLFLLLSFVIAQAYSQNFLSKEICGERGISRQFTPVDDDQLINFNAVQVRSLPGPNQKHCTEIFKHNASVML